MWHNVFAKPADPWRGTVDVFSLEPGARFRKRKNGFAYVVRRIGLDAHMNFVVYAGLVGAERPDLLYPGTMVYKA